MTPQEIILIVLIVFFGGLVKGLNGFGYAIISMSLLSTIIPVQKAVALMIIPLMAGNIQLIHENRNSKLRKSLKDYRVLLFSLFAGVTVSMILLSLIPVKLLEVFVGLISIVFVFSRASYMESYFVKIQEICFRTYEPLIGFLSGIVYGASNVAITLVMYLKSRDLERREFMALLAFTVLSVSIYRIVLASLTGLYTSSGNLLFSTVLAFPAALSVLAGNRLSKKVPNKLIGRISLLIVFLVGLKLISGY